jgi:hypothetical protein
MLRNTVIQSRRFAIAPLAKNYQGLSQQKDRYIARDSLSVITKKIDARNKPCRWCRSSGQRRKGMEPAVPARASPEQGIYGNQEGFGDL